MGSRILVISHMYPNPVNPIAGIFVHNQAKALQKEGAEVQIAMPVPSFPFYPKWRKYRHLPKRTEKEGIPVHYIPTRMYPGGFFFQRYGQYYIKSLQAALREIHKEFPFELIHCHTIFPDGYAGGELKKEWGVPLVSTIHGSDIMLYPYRKPSIHEQTVQALKASDLVITVSKRLQEEAGKLYPEANTVTIYNGFDPERFRPRNRLQIREKLGLDPRKKLILFIGNLYPVKGIHYLLEAFAEVRKLNRDILLYLVGDGPLRSELEQNANELGISEAVDFLGRKPYAEIPDWISSADITVLTSLSEGLPSILLESMGCGRAMVATDVGGIGEILQDGKTGLLAPAGDSGQIARCLQKILVDEPSLVTTMGENAYQASRALTWRENARQTLQCYTKLLK
ncbi:MAG: glycosyltransferase family 4 protein [Thermoactinomyces sp.]